MWAVSIAYWPVGHAAGLRAEADIPDNDVCLFCPGAMHLQACRWLMWVHVQRAQSCWQGGRRESSGCPGPPLKPSCQPPLDAVCCAPTPSQHGDPAQSVFSPFQLCDVGFCKNIELAHFGMNGIADGRTTSAGRCTFNREGAVLDWQLPMIAAATRARVGRFGHRTHWEKIGFATKLKNLCRTC